MRASTCRQRSRFPRWTVWPSTYPIDLGHPYELRIEAQAGESVIAGLAERGHKVIVQRPWAQSRIGATIAAGPGEVLGSSDPRAEEHGGEVTIREIADNA